MHELFSCRTFTDQTVCVCVLVAICALFLISCIHLDNNLMFIWSTLKAEDSSWNYKEAFLEACQQYNEFGAASQNVRLQIDEATSLRLYGLKVA